MGLLLSPQRVSGLAVGGGWLVAAMSGGCVRSFRLPSHEEGVPVDLGELLPAQDATVVGNVALVSGRRALFLVDVLGGVLLRKLATPFSGRPSVVAEGPCVFAKCDEAIRVWPLEVLSVAGGAEAQDLSKPHRQITTGLAVLPGGQSVITSSPEEVRGWSYVPANARETKLIFKLLWTVSLKELCPSAQGAWETSSLLWWRQDEAAASVLLRGDQGGRVVFHELRLGALFAEEPKLAERALPAEAIIIIIIITIIVIVIIVIITIIVIIIIIIILLLLFFFFFFLLLLLSTSKACALDDDGRDAAAQSESLILLRRGAGWVACAARAPPAGLSLEAATAFSFFC